MAARAACGERDRLRFEVALDSVLVGAASSLDALSDDEVLVLDVEGFLDEMPSSVALESVDLDSSDGILSLPVFDALDAFIGGAASDSLLLDEVSPEDEAGTGFFAGLSAEELLSDDELSDDDARLLADAGPDLDRIEALGAGLVVLVGSALETAFMIVSAFGFFAGGASSSDDDELESESELDCLSESALRLSWLMRPLTVGFGSDTLPPEGSFSSSASLSELEAEEAPDDGIVLLDFVWAFTVGFECFLVSGSLSELELDDEPDVSAAFARFLFTLEIGVPFDSFGLELTSSLLVSLLSLLDVWSAVAVLVLFPLRVFSPFANFAELLSPASSLLLLVSGRVCS